MVATNLRKFDVAVVGAGLVGASTALWLQSHGYNVALIDRNLPGTGTSYGNACTIATYASIPINSPSVFRRLPSLLSGGDGPFCIDWRYAVSHLPWIFSFLRNCSAARTERISRALGQLLRLVDTGIDPLVERSGAHEIISDPGGFLYVYSDKANFENARKDVQTRVNSGSVCREISSEEILQRQPNLKIPIHRGFVFEDVRYLRNPKKLVEYYVNQFTKDGGEFLQLPVASVTPNPNDVTMVMNQGTMITCNKVVVAAGAWSRSILGSGAEDLPLDTERGYHVLFSDHADLVEFPLCWAEAGFYAVPMEQGLRIAGVVEIAGLNKPANKSCTDYLTQRAHQLFGDLGDPHDTWLGFRPTFPDALPVIGESHRTKNIFFAFGHQHIGVTLSGITGKIIADLVAGREPPMDLSPYSANRFI